MKKIHNWKKSHNWKSDADAQDPLSRQRCDSGRASLALVLVLMGLGFMSVIVSWLEMFSSCFVISYFIPCVIQVLKLRMRSSILFAMLVDQTC